MTFRYELLYYCLADSDWLRTILSTKFNRFLIYLLACNHSNIGQNVKLWNIKLHIILLKNKKRGLLKKTELSSSYTFTTKITNI